MNALDIGARGLARRALDVQRLPDRAALQRALVDATDHASLFLTEPGREGRFIAWRAASFEDEFGYAVADAKAADPQQGIFVATDDNSKIAMRPISGGTIRASWFGWTRNANGGTGAGNKAALQAVEDLIASDMSGGNRPFASGLTGSCAVDLGWGEFDLGEPGDTVGLMRANGNYQGHGFTQTQINWKGDAGATVVRWDPTFRGFFRHCRFGSPAWIGDNAPKRWIDCTYDAALGGTRLNDWSDDFDNFYCDVTGDADAAAVVLLNVVNFVFREARFQGGTRHVLVYQNSQSSNNRGLSILNYTFDFSNAGAGVFSESVCVDVTGSGSLVVNLFPSRCEGGLPMAPNGAVVRVRDTQGPNAIGATAVTVNLMTNTGFDFSGTTTAWLVYHETTQSGPNAPWTAINAPCGLFLKGFQGLRGGNWNNGVTAWSPTFGTIVAIPPYFSAKGNYTYLGPKALTSGELAFGSEGATFRTYNGNPEGTVAAVAGSLCMRPSGMQGFTSYRKSSGTGSTGWINISKTKGAITGTTDGNGDLTVAHNFGAVPTKINVRIDGPTLYHTAIHTAAGATFKVRVFDAAGIAKTATTVTGWWEAETTS